MNLLLEQARHRITLDVIEAGVQIIGRLAFGNLKEVITF